MQHFLNTKTSQVVHLILLTPKRRTSPKIPEKSLLVHMDSDMKDQTVCSTGKYMDN